jgi:hypothetical protein
MIIFPNWMRERVRRLLGYFSINKDKETPKNNIILNYSNLKNVLSKFSDVGAEPLNTHNDLDILDVESFKQKAEVL